MTSGSVRPMSASLLGADDLDRVAWGQPGDVPCRPWHYGAVERNRDAARVGPDLLLVEQGRNGRGAEPFALAVDPDDSDLVVVHVLVLFGGLRPLGGFHRGGRGPHGGLRRKTLDAERPDGGIDLTIDDQPRHGVGRDRCQQDAVAVMAGRIEQAIDRPGTENWGIVAAARPMTDP